MKKEPEQYVILNDALQNVAKHIWYMKDSYRPVFVKMDHYGSDHSFEAYYARHRPSGFSTENYLFKVQGTDFNDMMKKFLDTYQRLLDEGYISSSTPPVWCYKCIKLEY